MDLSSVYTFHHGIVITRNMGSQHISITIATNYGNSSRITGQSLKCGSTGQMEAMGSMVVQTRHVALMGPLTTTGQAQSHLCVKWNLTLFSSVMRVQVCDGLETNGASL